MPRTAKPAGVTFPAGYPHDFGPFYAFDQDSGTLVPDLSPIGAPPLTVSGGTWTTGPYGRELALSGGATASAADDPKFRRPTGAITAMVGYTPTQASMGGALILAKLISGYDTWALFDGTTNPFAARAFGEAALQTAYAGTPEILHEVGVPYLIALRWASGGPVNVRTYRRDTGEMIATTDSASTMGGSLVYSAHPFQLGPAPGKYDLAATSPQRIGDSDLDDVVANMWIGWGTPPVAYRPRPRTLTIIMPGVGT